MTDRPPLMKLTGSEFPRLEDTERGRRKVAEPECTCFPVPPEYWTTHYGAVDPATMFEPNPECPEHFPATEENPR